MSTIMGYNLTITEPVDLFVLANNLTGGNLILIFIVVFWMISMASFSRVIGIKSIPVSFFATFVLSIMFYWLQLVSLVAVGVSFSGLIIGVFLSIVGEE